MPLRCIQVQVYMCIRSQPSQVLGLLYLVPSPQLCRRHPPRLSPLTSVSGHEGHVAVALLCTAPSVYLLGCPPLLRTCHLAHLGCIHASN